VAADNSCKKVAMLESDFTLALSKSDPDFLATNLVTLKCNFYRQVSTSTLETEELDRIKSFLRNWLPVFNRRTAKWYQHEDLQDLLAIQIHSWKKTMQSEGCSFAIFETAGSHHFSTLSFEIACDLLKIKKVFLTHTAFTNRLIPMVQQGEYANRERMIGKFSDYELTAEFLNMDSERWKRRTSLVDRQEQSQLSFYISMTLKFFKKNAYRILSKMKNLEREFTLDDWIENQYGYTLIEEIFINFQQIKALRFLRKLEKGSAESSNNGTEMFGKKSSIDLFLVYASFQPEASSFPLGGFFTSHFKLIMSLRSKFPNSIIYYREHPHIKRRRLKYNGSRVGLHRSKLYYENLRRLGCIFLNNQSHLSLLSRPGIKLNVVSICVYVAIERALQGKNTFIAGTPWYLGMPGTQSLSDFLALAPCVPHQSEIDIDSVRRWILNFHYQSSIAQPKWSYTLENVPTAEYERDLKNLIRIIISK